MSRYTDYDDDDENWALNMGRWEHNTRSALKGKRGRKVLAELREALLALPEHKLIEGAMCTVGWKQRRAGIVAEETRAWEQMDPQWRPAVPYADDSSVLEAAVDRNGGEGVCAIGAYLWYRKVKAGADPAEAFDALPTLLGDNADGVDSLAATADLAKAEAGMVFTLAWDLAYRNDETLRAKTPEQRHAAFIEWIDRELAEVA